MIPQLEDVIPLCAVEFADPPPPIPVQYLPEGIQSGEPREEEPLIPMTGAPTTLMQWAVLILNTPNPMLKVRKLEI